MKQMGWTSMWNYCKRKNESEEFGEKRKIENEAGRYEKKLRELGKDVQDK